MRVSHDEGIGDFVVLELQLELLVHDLVLNETCLEGADDVCSYWVYLRT